MPFVLTNLVEHGAGNPIVARLSAQILGLARQTTPKEKHDAIGAKYLDLMKRLLVCYEIKEQFRTAFNRATDAIEAQHAAGKAGGAVVLPQIPRLEEEARNFLVEAKGYVRELLQVVNLLYGTAFEEASEFSSAKKRKGATSLIAFVRETFGENDARTKMFGEAGAFINHLVALRNAAEHPDGSSGRLVVTNFTLTKEGIEEPTWYRIKDGQLVHRPASIREEYNTFLHNLLTLGEDIFVSWAAENLIGDGVMMVVEIPPEQRNNDMPVRYTTTLRPDLLQALAAKQASRKGSGK